MPTKTPSQFEELKERWQGHHDTIRQRVKDKHSDAFDYLQKKASPKKMMAGAAGSAVLLLSPAHSLIEAPDIVTAEGLSEDVQGLSKQSLLQRLQAFVPEANEYGQVRNLEPEEERHLEQELSEHFDLNISAELDGKRLNRTYGLMGAEQHLYRYPGDTLKQHAVEEGDVEKYLPSGIAPGLGAWGHFVPSKADFTEEDMLRERYYLAVQTFEVPDYLERVGEYRDFFQFRKMLVVNTITGEAVVAVIGDAGPAPWTGKHLGGSPEVMEAVSLHEGPRKGAVLYFFIDDPDDKVPLGPIER